MKGIVIGLTFEDACLQLDNIYDSYTQLKIKPVRCLKTENNYVITFENNDFWKAIKAVPFSKAQRYNVGYINKNIPSYLIEEVCKPMISRPPFNEIHYY